MGIRPKFLILVGIIDAKLNDDPRYTPPEDEDALQILLWEDDLTPEQCWRGDWDKKHKDWWWDDYREHEQQWPNRSLCLGEKLYNTPPYPNDTWLKNIVGYVVHQGPYDDPVVRALSAIDPAWVETRWFEIPTLDPDQHALAFRHYGYTQEDVDAHRFVSSVFENCPNTSRNDWSRTRHYLKMVGWDIPENDLRYILVANWS